MASIVLFLLTSWLKMGSNTAKALKFTGTEFRGYFEELFSA